MVGAVLSLEAYWEALGVVNADSKSEERCRCMSASARALDARRRRGAE